MSKVRIQVLFVAFCMGVANTQSPGSTGGGYGLTGYGNPGYAGSVGFGSNELGTGSGVYTPGGISGASGFTPGGVSGASGFTPGGVSGASGFTPGGVSGASGFTPGGISGASGYTPGVAGSSPNSAGASGNPNSRIFGLLSGGGLFGRGGGLFSNLFGGNRQMSATSYPVAYPVPVPSAGFGGFGGGGFPSYGGGFYG